VALNRVDLAADLADRTLPMVVPYLCAGHICVWRNGVRAVVLLIRNRANAYRYSIIALTGGTLVN
jgi:hypothetical protein